MQSARGKRIADSVEALLGATFLASGGGLALGCKGATPESAQQQPQSNEGMLQPASMATGTNINASAAPVGPTQTWDTRHLTRALAGTALLCERMSIMPPYSSKELTSLLTGERANMARAQQQVRSILCIRFSVWAGALSHPSSPCWYFQMFRSCWQKSKSAQHPHHEHAQISQRHSLFLPDLPHSGARQGSTQRCWSAAHAHHAAGAPGQAAGCIHGAPAGRLHVP